MRPHRKKPTISLCMIVKDEAFYLRDCLRSVHDVVDEMIIVDTGSTDDTVNIALEFGARVHHLEWRDDFSAARNECLKHASGEWIFQIDADERLDVKSKRKLRKLARSKNKSQMCFNVLIDSPAATHKKGHISRAHRLFRNLPGIRYSGRVHEQITPSVAALGGQEGFSDILLHHLGYAKDDADMAAKSQRNFELLRRQVQDEPQNAYWHFTLAQNLTLSKNFDQAQEHLLEALRLGGLPRDIVCSIHNNLAEVLLRSGDYESAIEQAKKALAITSGQTTAHLLLFEIYGCLGDTQKQIDCLRAAIALVESKGQTVNQVSLEAYVDLAALHLNLANRLLAKKDFAQARTSYEKAVRLSPENTSALRGLAECLLQMGDFTYAETTLTELRRRLPKDNNVLESLAWLAIKRQDFEQAIERYEALRRLDPGNPGFLKRLAGLYNRIGQRERSLELLGAAVR